MTLEEFKRLNKSIGNYWFSESTMEFFKCRIEHWENDRGYFITSELGPTEQCERLFTIRKGDFNTGRVRTVGSFQEYETLYKAKKALNNILIEVTHE